MNSSTHSIPTSRNAISQLPNLRSILTSAILLGTAAFAVADVKLRGNIGPRTIDDNVVIVRGTNCNLTGTIIKGNIIVQPGAKLVTYGARVTGNVQAYKSLLVDLRLGTRVNGDVQGEGTRSLFVRDGTRVGGNVQLKEAYAPSGINALVVKNAIVVGDVQAEKSTGSLRVFENKIGGNLQFVENVRGPYIITNNVIRGDLQFFKNKGAGTITGNYVGGNLQSKENSIRPVVRRNIVEGDTELE